MLAAFEAGAEIVAYTDADLSTPVREIDRLVGRLQSEDDVDVVLGARVRLLGTDIRRSGLRHVVGRVYGTFASLALGVAVYDTQCGAKAFRKTPGVVGALSRPFSVRWTFDVELLSRLTRTSDAWAWARIIEEPLSSWHARRGSKLRAREAVQETLSLLRIGWRHRRDRVPRR